MLYGWCVLMALTVGDEHNHRCNDFSVLNSFTTYGGTDLLG